MHIFSKLCFCTQASVPFRSTRDFDDHVVSRVFCPACVDRSPAEALLLRVAGTHGRDGVYGIDWNQGYLLEKDPSFEDEESYYKRLVESGGVVPNFVPPGADRSVTVVGIKSYLPSETAPDGKTAALMDGPKRGRGRPRKADKILRKP